MAWNLLRLFWLTKKPQDPRLYLPTTKSSTSPGFLKIRVLGTELRSSILPAPCFVFETRSFFFLKDLLIMYVFYLHV